MLSAIPNFPWSLSVPVMVILAMLIFREPIAALIRRVVEFKAGRVSMKAKGPSLDREVMTEIKEIAAQQAATDDEHLEARRLVIRDSKGRVRILASTLESSGEAFLALVDEDGEVRASLGACSSADPTGVAMLLFPRKGRPPGDMASFIGAEADGSGAVGIRDSSGTWREMS
jgi:hypothetical protein